MHLILGQHKVGVNIKLAGPNDAQVGVFLSSNILSALENIIDSEASLTAEPSDRCRLSRTSARPSITHGQVREEATRSAGVSGARADTPS
jgi:hypothetical protein